MVLDKLFTFQAIEGPQRNENRRPSELLQTRNGNEKTIGENRFQDILRGISERQDSKNEDKPVTLKDINEKIENLEQKIENAEKNVQNLDETQRKNLEELKSVIEKIKELLKTKNDDNQKVRLNFGKVSIDFTAFISEILTKITEMMGMPNQKDLANLLNFLNKKLDETKEILGTTQSKNGTKKEVNIDLGMNKSENNTEGDPSKSEKVKVIDKRTMPSENSPVDKNGKTAKTASQVGESTADLNNAAEKKVVKSFSDSLYHKVLEKENTETGKMKEFGSIFQNRLEQNQAASAKQYTGFTSLVSKANLEALLQNVVGRAMVTIRDGRSEMKMNLVPPELGRMSMKLTLEEGQVIGKIVVSTPEAKALFDQNLGDLQRAMQQAGINLAQLDVSLGQDSNTAEQNSFGPDGLSVNQIDHMEYENNENEEYTKNSLWESTINFIA